jgi:hypothetical protein
MHDTSSTKSARPTLKLKVGTPRPAGLRKTTTTPQPDKKSKLKPGAHWSDEYKQRMQADMDALLTRGS